MKKRCDVCKKKIEEYRTPRGRKLAAATTCGGDCAAIRKYLYFAYGGRIFITDKGYDKFKEQIKNYPHIHHAAIS